MCYTGVDGFYWRMVYKIRRGSTITGKTDSHTNDTNVSVKYPQHAQHASSSNHFNFGQSTHLESISFAWLILCGNIQKVKKPVRSDVKCDMFVMTLARDLCMHSPPEILFARG